MDLKAPVEGHDGIFVVRRGENCRDWNGIHYQVGLSEKNVGCEAAVDERRDDSARRRRLRAHPRRLRGDALHPGRGASATSTATGLTQVVENTAGDFIFIEPGVPHEVFNASDTEPVVAVVARSDASEWQNIIPYASPYGRPTPACERRSPRHRRQPRHRRRDRAPRRRARLRGLRQLPAESRGRRGSGRGDHGRRRRRDRGRRRRGVRAGRRPAVRDRHRGARPDRRALVNNAGILERQTRVEHIDAARLDRVFATNVRGAFLCAREAVRRMSTAHGGAGGAIVNVSSRAAQLGAPGEYVDYAASKAALDTLTIGLAREVAGEGIRVNGVRAGIIYTDIHADGGEPGRVDRSARRCRCSAAGTRSKSRARSCGCCPTRRRTRPGRSSTSPAG